jgi:hypothetical protein
MLMTGEALEVDGSLEHVAKQLEDAARSSAGALAWFSESATGEKVGLNPVHVVMLRAVEAPGS